jgi:hypothetical protein
VGRPVAAARRRRPALRPRPRRSPRGGISATD